MVFIAIYLSHLEHSHSIHTSTKSLISSFPDKAEQQEVPICEEMENRMQNYLVDFLLWVCEECREVAQSITIEHHLCLFICTSYYIPNSPQGSSLSVQGEHKKFINLIRNTVRPLKCISMPHCSFISISLCNASSYLNFDLLVTEQRYQKRDNARVYDHLYLLIPSISQIRQSPHCVYQDLETAKKTKLIFFAVCTPKNPIISKKVDKLIVFK